MIRNRSWTWLFVLPGLAVDGQVISASYGDQKRIEKALREWCARGCHEQSTDDDGRMLF